MLLIIVIAGARPAWAQNHQTAADSAPSPPTPSPTPLQDAAASTGPADPLPAQMNEGQAGAVIRRRVEMLSDRLAKMEQQLGQWRDDTGAREQALREQDQAIEAQLKGRADQHRQLIERSLQAADRARRLGLDVSRAPWNRPFEQDRQQLEEWGHEFANWQSSMGQWDRDVQSWQEGFGDLTTQVGSLNGAVQTLVQRAGLPAPPQNVGGAQAGAPGQGDHLDTDAQALEDRLYEVESQLTIFGEGLKDYQIALDGWAEALPERRQWSQDWDRQLREWSASLTEWEQHLPASPTPNTAETTAN